VDVEVHTIRTAILPQRFLRTEDEDAAPTLGLYSSVGRPATDKSGESVELAREFSPELRVKINAPLRPQ
jgi:hypothetical protein